METNEDISGWRKMLFECCFALKMLIKDSNVATNYILKCKDQINVESVECFGLIFTGSQSRLMMT